MDNIATFKIDLEKPVKEGLEKIKKALLELAIQSYKEKGEEVPQELLDKIQNMKIDDDKPNN